MCLVNCEVGHNEVDFLIQPVFPHETPKKFNVDIFSCPEFQIFISKVFIKIYSTTFQDPTRDLVDPTIKFVRWCLYFKLNTLQLLHKEL